MKGMYRLATPTGVGAVLKKHGFRFKKSLGQNFLVDENIRAKIVSAAELTGQDVAWEIGPGIGTLTQALADAAGYVFAVELDERLLAILAETLAGYQNIRVIHGDFLGVDLGELYRESRLKMGPEGSLKIVANLPYYVTTPVIARILEASLDWQLMVVMVQAEVAARMVAPPGGKDYGMLSVLVQYYTETKAVARAPRTVFMPQPEVDSTVVRLRRRPVPRVVPADSRFFFALVRAAFGQRRKTLRNAVKSLAGLDPSSLEGAFVLASIDPMRRGETLSLEEFAALADAILAMRG
ncbi:MAG: 16S rRNA (adenine(1518)-N(6)/adenine(1519)-N(6))-dimethyltransferase RsmA [Syntrophothermus sp.]